MSHKGERAIVSIIGKTNTGKSSFINALIGQSISIVSDQAGTTTDAVGKVYELIPVGPVSFYDTAGYDDPTQLGLQRIKATERKLWKSDIVIILFDENGINETDLNLIQQITDKKVPLIVVFNKSDLNYDTTEMKKALDKWNLNIINVSSVNAEHTEKVKDALIDLIKILYEQKSTMTDGLINKNDIILLSIPIDLSAPKGRIILPQVQVIREILDQNAVAISAQPSEIPDLISKYPEMIKLVITDSQAIKELNAMIPDNIPLTTFSVIMANYKGELKTFIEGMKQLETLQDGDQILIAEACSHHVQCDDIGRFKIPKFLKEFTDKDLNFEFVNAYDFPEDLNKFKLVIHCGACMISSREMSRRMNECTRLGIPITNYGLIISKTQGVFDRVIKVFK